MKSSSPTRRFQSPWVQPLALSTVISAIQLMVARPVAGSGGEIGYSTTRCRSEPTPTKDAPLRIGTPGVVPRHMMAPPHWMGGCAGYICARTAECRPSAATSRRPSTSRAPAVARLDERGDAVGVIAIAGDPVAEANRAGAESLERRPVQHHLQLAAVHRVLRPAVAREQAARLGIDVVAVAADQRPLPRLDADGAEDLVVEARGRTARARRWAAG